MDSKRLYNQAYEQHYTQKNYVEAMKLYSLIVKEFPKSLEAKIAQEQINKLKSEVGELQFELDEIAATYKPQFELKSTIKNEIEGNSIAETIRIIGIIEIIAGLIIGLFAGSQYRVFVWQLALTWWAVGAVSGIIFIGFAEVIRLLHEINVKINRPINL